MRIAPATGVDCRRHIALGQNKIHGHRRPAQRRDGAVGEGNPLAVLRFQGALPPVDLRRRRGLVVRLLWRGYATVAVVAGGLCWRRCAVAAGLVVCLLWCGYATVAVVAGGLCWRRRAVIGGRRACQLR